MTKLSDFDYQLPKELIAQFPNKRRDLSRLLVLNRASGRVEHQQFSDLPHYLQKGDALVVNNTRVFKARLIGRRTTGAEVEIFLVRKLAQRGERWLALATLSRRLKEGEKILFGDELSLVIEKGLGEGQWEVSFATKVTREKVVSHFGHVPLPHYIARADQPADLRRYQTVFANKEKAGAVAAPTAGFHFTLPLLKGLEKAGISLVELTLHVGPGTFRPISAEQIEDHTVDPEWAELDAAAARQLNKVRKAGGRIFAVGTTSTRVLESLEIIDGKIQPFEGMVDLYIRPGHSFRLVDHLITNFHLPKSSLLVLVSAFAGREQILKAYQEAVAQKYRFYSYGDAMLIL